LDQLTLTSCFDSRVNYDGQLGTIAQDFVTLAATIKVGQGMVWVYMFLAWASSYVVERYLIDQDE
jgi:hypothetical protein